MDVKTIKLLNKETGALIEVSLNETELQMLLSYGINDLLNRGAMSLFSPEDAAKMNELEAFLNMEAEGSKQ
jgi:hypothetical protein